MKTSNLKVGDVRDDARADMLRKTLEAIPAVRAATVHEGDVARVDVQYDETGTTPELLVAKLRDEGWDAEIGGKSAGNAR